MMKLLVFYRDDKERKEQESLVKNITGIEIEFIDYNKAPEMVKDYQLRIMPAIVLLDDYGEFSRKLSGIISPRMVGILSEWIPLENVGYVVC